jgi:hypothetical protein
VKRLFSDSLHPVPVPVPPSDSYLKAGSGSSTVESLPEEKQILTGKILGAIGSDADDGTEFVVQALARRLPPSSLAKVFESLVANRADIRDRAAYAVGALRLEFAELAGQR